MEWGIPVGIMQVQDPDISEKCSFFKRCCQYVINIKRNKVSKVQYILKSFLDI